ncbi:MAG: glycoside hydrolase family 2, partial [Lachnospiraceae bacterium]|nr:glycoside hydrolase family 2 [Lachnospiraceae bacterium]
MRRLWNEGWSFLRLEVGTELSDALERAQDFVPVDIPHDWLIYDASRLYENGTGWYLKNFTWTGDGSKRLFLVFEGIYMDSAVYVNGHKAAEWKYGYSTFTVEITEHVRKGANQILVSACFQAPNSRWYSGAGIYRNVWMKETERTCIVENGIYISTRRQQDDFVLRVETAVDVPADASADREADMDLGGQRDYEITHRLFYQNREVLLKPVKDDRNGREYLVEKPVLWDVEEPALYTLKTCLSGQGEIWQQEECSFGFRYTAFDPDEGFFLNGRHVKLKGVCEHHD